MGERGEEIGMRNGIQERGMGGKGIKSWIKTKERSFRDKEREKFKHCAYIFLVKASLKNNVTYISNLWQTLTTILFIDNNPVINNGQSSCTCIQSAFPTAAPASVASYLITSFLNTVRHWLRDHHHWLLSTHFWIEAEPSQKPTVSWLSVTRIKQWKLSYCKDVHTFCLQHGLSAVTSRHSITVRNVFAFENIWSSFN